MSIQEPGQQGGDLPPFAQAAVDQARQALDQANQQVQSHDAPTQTAETPIGNDANEPESAAGENVQKFAVPDDAAILAELKRWKQNSRRRVKQGKAPRQFESDILPDELHDEIWERLKDAKTVGAVDQAFAGPFFW